MLISCFSCFRNQHAAKVFADPELWNARFLKLKVVSIAATSNAPSCANCHNIKLTTVPSAQGVENPRNPLTGIVDFSAGILDEVSKWSLLRAKINGKGFAVHYAFAPLYEPNLNRNSRITLWRLSEDFENSGHPASVDTQVLKVYRSQSTLPAEVKLFHVGVHLDATLWTFNEVYDELVKINPTFIYFIVGIEDTLRTTKRYRVLAHLLKIECTTRSLIFRVASSVSGFEARNPHIETIQLMNPRIPKSCCRDIWTLFWDSLYPKSTHIRVFGLTGEETQKCENLFFFASIWPMFWFGWVKE